ncbi:hypothetical protein ACPB8Q_04615 [Methanocaldococcus indicus]|uniref:family 16 glycoside hydrolase n=1 Tax=Methanocaldococcus indicus TaxID=213231 RepID=UPI003C6D9E83
MKKLLIFSIVIILLGTTLSGCFKKGVGEFYDDFSEYQLGQTAPFGEWKVKNGTFIITLPPALNLGVGGANQNPGNNKVVQCVKDGIMYLDINYTDFVYSIDVLVPKDMDKARIYFRLQDNATVGYYILINPNINGYVLYKFNHTKVEKLAQSLTAATTLGPMFLRYTIIANKGKIILKVQGQKYLEYNDTHPILYGGIGFGGKGCYFDNVHVIPAGYTY